MSKGTPRITVRIPPAMLADVDAAVASRNAAPNQVKNWTRTEYVLQAVVDKLNHDLRSRGLPGSRRQATNEDWFPRQYWGE